MAEKKVSVEMTEQQKSKVVDILAKETQTTEKKWVRLLTQHRINGVPYGPGEIEVPAAMAGLLLANDHKAMDSRIREMHSGESNVEIVGRGITRAVRG